MLYFDCLSSFVVACIQYNNWFTFSEYEEPVTIRSCRPIHARELSMVGTLLCFSLKQFTIYCITDYISASRNVLVSCIFIGLL